MQILDRMISSQFPRSLSLSFSLVPHLFIASVVFCLVRAQKEGEKTRAKLIKQLEDWLLVSKYAKGLSWFLEINIISFLLSYSRNPLFVIPPWGLPPPGLGVCWPVCGWQLESICWENWWCWSGHNAESSTVVERCGGGTRKLHWRPPICDDPEPSHGGNIDCCQGIFFSEHCGKHHIGPSIQLYLLGGAPQQSRSSRGKETRLRN